MSDEIKALAEELRGFASACGGRPGDGSFAVSINDGKLSFLEKTRPSAHDIERALVSTLREAAAALDRLSGRVTVKALEFCYGEAHCALGVYKVDSGQNSKGGRQWAWALTPPDDPFYMFQHAEKSDSEEAAQAAAQADFESRILAALDTAPALSPDQIRRGALKIVKRKSAEARKHPGASVAVTYLDEVAGAIEALITGGDDDHSNP